jgi:hypothetical protein
MAEVTISDTALQIELTVPERVLSLHATNVLVARRDITGARIVRDILGQIRGMRMPGARFPGILAIGTWHGMFRQTEYHDFVLVHRPGPGVLITTTGGYDRILLGTNEPEQFVAELGF